ncbi:MAG TPA: M20/M25/M40 family metallo-hydrolase [Bryobacteraceae bacterium]|jgi:acetylornithine deacetylase/succinyl-diaminopimelate desuccinylase-like protein
MRFAALLLLTAALSFAQPRYPLDWARLEPELLDRFTELLRIDTSNPPGNETRAAKAIEAVLAREGIASKLFAMDPARANLVARIKGNGSKRPLLIMGHTDVVGAPRERWTVDPFAAIRKNGVIYARGTVDDKEHAVAGMMILILLKRMKVPLDRDVIFLAEAGEESDTPFGINFMVKDHWPEIEAEYALAEGGAMVEVNGKVHHLLLGTTEKMANNIRLVARGSAGHGSRPTLDNAVVHLAQAVARAGTWSTPIRLNETTRAYFEGLAAVSPRDEAARYRAVLDPQHAAEADRYFRAHDPTTYSLLRNSIAPTILKGGFRENVIPSEAEATLNVRLLPGENLADFMADLRRVIDDPAVQVIPPSTVGRPPAPPSRMDTEMFRALEQVGRRMFGASALPNMLTGSTDMAQLRAKGVQAYGVGPVVKPEEGPLGLAHADDEHISVESLKSFFEYVWNSVIEVAAHR